jgi:hypothetical protein
MKEFFQYTNNCDFWLNKLTLKEFSISQKRGCFETPGLFFFATIKEVDYNIVVSERATCMTFFKIK